MVKIIAIGDFHGKFPDKLKNLIKKERPDFILCSGDFGGSDEFFELVISNFYDKWWEKIGNKRLNRLILSDYNSGKKILGELNKLGVRIYSVLGNWDFETAKTEELARGLKLKKYPRIMKQMRNFYYLNKEIKEVEGLKIYGFGGFVTSSIYMTKESGFDKEEIEKYKNYHEKNKKKLFKKAEKDIDILLAHYPVYGVFDKIKAGKENPMNGKNIGFKGYNEFIEKFKPRLFICGHMHEYQGKEKLGDTLVVSTGPAKNGKAAVIEMGEGEKEKSKIDVRFV